MHTVWKNWRSEYGANVAQTAAVAILATALIGVLTLLSPKLSQQVDSSFQCLVGALSGGAGEGCAANAAAEDAPPTDLDDLGGEGCDAMCQIIGILKGFAEGFWDALWGLVSLGKDLVLLIAGDDETWAKYTQLIEAFMRDPVGVAKALLGETAAPIIEDWEAGRYGEATGRLLFEVISTIGGPKALDKLGKLGKLDDLGDVGRHVDDLPCVGAAPRFKAPGLAKPAADACDINAGRIARNKAALDEALRGHQPTRFNGPDGPVVVTNERLRHFLERHHPKYYSTDPKATQSFFDRNLSVRDIENLARETVQRGIRRDNTFYYKRDGVWYRATIRDGQVVQFHPLEPSKLPSDIEP